MKRWFSLLLVLVLLLTGCDLVPPPEPTEEPTATESVQESTDSSTEASAPESTAPPRPEGLMISEVMADNKLLSLGHDRDWVELHNPGDTEVALDGFYLTDDAAKPQRLSLEGMTLPAGGYLVVELGEDAPFNLSADGETVFLFFGSEEYASLDFGVTENGESFSPAGPCTYVTPGYGDTEEGYRSALEDRQLPALIINEVLSSNSKFPAPDGGSHDLVEIKNISDKPVSLSGYTLSDKRSEPERYVFPDAVLESGEFYVVYCSDNTALGQNHAPFKISADGETLYLSKDGVFTDALSVPGDLGKNESYGRSGKLPAYFPSPTPGKENGQGQPTGLAAPTADLPSGIYEEAVTVTLQGEGTVYYTTDGSRPTTGSKVYTKPLNITGVTTIRTFCVSGERTSSLTAYTYAVGAKHDLPVVCVSIPQYALTGDTGVLNHIENNYEHEAVLTLIENGEEKFSVPFGFRLHGNDSRKMDKQNFQLRFRSEYGAGKLKYPLFENREFTEYNSLLLKGGSEDWNVAMLRDEFCTGLVAGQTALYTQAIKPVVLYLGGTYWGVYYLRERINDDYVASHLGVSTGSVDLLNSTAGYEQAGSNDDFKALKAYVQSHDMSQKEHYDYLAERIDVLSLMDWYICRSFVGDIDLANIRRFRSSEADGKWHWAYFDLDWAMYRPVEKAFTKLLSNKNGEPILIKALLKSPEGRDLFLKRCDELFDTVLSEAHFLQVLEELVAQIRSEVPADRARWGRSIDSWEKAIQTIRNFVKDGQRHEILKQDLKEYFGLSAEEMAAYFG